MDTQPLQVLIITAAGRLCTSLQAVVASLPMVCGVYTAADEATGVQKLTTTFIDVVVLDGELPRAVQQRILRHLQQSTHAITTILFGGTEQAHQRALYAGVTTWLSIDCSTELLARKIHNAYQARQS